MRRRPVRRPFRWERQPGRRVSVSLLRPGSERSGVLRLSRTIGIGEARINPAAWRSLPLRPGPRGTGRDAWRVSRSEEHTSELQSRLHLVCRLLLEKKKKKKKQSRYNIKTNVLHLE